MKRIIYLNDAYRISNSVIVLLKRFFFKIRFLSNIHWGQQHKLSKSTEIYNLIIGKNEQAFGKVLTI